MRVLKLLITFSLLFICVFPSIVEGKNTRVATIKNVTGEVFIKKSGGKKEFKATNGMSLSQGDSVRTGKKSSANIYYDNGSKSSIGANSKIMITQLSDKKDGNQSKTKVFSGELWNSVKNLTNTNDKYDVETPTAVMGVRGTLFLVSTDPITGESIVSVLDGKVAVDLTGDEGIGNKDDRIVQINEVQDIRTSQNTKLPDVRILNEESFVKGVDPGLLVEAVKDIADTIAEANRKALEQQNQFDKTGDQKAILEAIRLTKVAQTLSNIGKNVISEIQKEKAIEKEVKSIIDERKYDSLVSLQSKVDSANKDAVKLEKTLTDAAKKSGVTEEQIKQIEVSSTIPNTTGNTNTNTGGGSGGSSGNPSPSGNPLGSTIPLSSSNKIVTFTGGIKFNFNDATMLSGANIKVNDVTSTTTLPSELKLAGSVIDVTLSNVTINPSTGVDLTLPIKSGANLSKVGIFYKNNTGGWEYQPTIVDGTHNTVTAKVTHFSTYAVLEGEKLSTPDVKIDDNVQLANGVIYSPDTPDQTKQISLDAVNVSGETIYYTLDGSTPTVYSTKYTGPFNVTNNSSVTIKAIAVKNNARPSDIKTFSIYRSLSDFGDISLVKDSVNPLKVKLIVNKEAGITDVYGIQANLLYEANTALFGSVIATPILDSNKAHYVTTDKVNKEIIYTQMLSVGHSFGNMDTIAEFTLLNGMTNLQIKGAFLVGKEGNVVSEKPFVIPMGG